MMETILQNQSIAIMILITSSASLGLIVLALFQGVLWQIRTSRLILENHLVLDKICARMLITQKEIEIPAEWGQGMSLEDMIKRDLEEHSSLGGSQYTEDPANLEPATNEELEAMMKEIKK